MLLTSLLILADGDQQQGGNPFTMMVPLLVILGLLYFLMIRPMRRQDKERKSLIEQTKKNDKVVTIGGIIGTVVSVADEEITLKVDDNTRIKFLRGSISRNLTQEETLKAQQAAAKGGTPAAPAATGAATETKAQK